MLKPISWDILCKYHRCSPVERIGRNEETELEYQKHLNLLKQKNIPIEKHITDNILCNNQVILVENTFPYWTTDDIRHYCIWWNYCGKNKLNIDEYDDYIHFLLEEKFNKQMKPLEDYIYFENIAENKSIPQIFHIHVFLRNIN